MQVRDYSVFFPIIIVDFAVVARINEKDKNETEDDGKSKEKKQNNNPWGCYAGHASQV